MTSELFQSEELTDWGASSFDIAEGVRRQRDVYKAQEILKEAPMAWVMVGEGSWGVGTLDHLQDTGACGEVHVP